MGKSTISMTIFNVCLPEGKSRGWPGSGEATLTPSSPAAPRPRQVMAMAIRAIRKIGRLINVMIGNSTTKFKNQSRSTKVTKIMSRKPIHQLV